MLKNDHYSWCYVLSLIPTPLRTVQGPAKCPAATKIFTSSKLPGRHHNYINNSTAARKRLRSAAFPGTRMSAEDAFDDVGDGVDETTDIVLVVVGQPLLASQQPPPGEQAYPGSQ